MADEYSATAAKSPTHIDGNLDLKPLRTRSSTVSYIQNRLQRFSVSSSSSTLQTVESAEDAKGPLGLTLLHEPSEPRIDFIFIHGLGGGSRKTWSYSSDPGLFWPKEWLPNEVGFRHVRLHSYGYNSDWTARKGRALTVHDFGQALLADIYGSPHLRKNGDTPIVLVAHSMGGLVAKKSVNLICKFESPVSPNYAILQQSFLTTIEDIEADSRYNPKDEHRSQMKLISSLLHVDQRPDATLLELKGKEHHGSCHWVTEESAFQDWMQEPLDSESCDPLKTTQQTDNKKILWLNGRPETGNRNGRG
ncbi:hypothetical protein N0V85_002679 [Neurospora sp. IMI 360204]|nr:hypothetical protein N0V85_002679 [Neurospora sp. IMI 360204]